MTVPIPAAVADVLATVCGFHDTVPCGHCAGTYEHHRAHLGRSDEEIVADVLLYRDNRQEWLEQGYAAYAAKQKEGAAR